MSNESQSGYSKEQEAVFDWAASHGFTPVTSEINDLLNAINPTCKKSLQVADTLNRVTAYLQAKKEVTGLHEEVIHVIHTSSGKHELRVSDLESLCRGEISGKSPEFKDAQEGKS